MTDPTTSPQPAPVDDTKLVEALSALLARSSPHARRAAFEDALQTVTRRTQ